MNKMNKMIIIVLMVMLIAAVAQVSAITCTLNNPRNNQYDSGAIKLNASSTWAGINLNTNVTNVTFTIGSTIFSNSTNNGTNTSAGAGDFTFTTTTASLSQGSYTAFATCYNETEASNVNVAVNSSSVTYVVDRTGVGVVVSNPLSGSTVVPVSNVVTFEYTATDANLANCTLNLNNNAVKSSTSATTTSNVTSRVLSRFTYPFSADNSTVRIAIGCNDLAGLASSSNALNNFTFNVLLGGVPYATKLAAQQQYSSNQASNQQFSAAFNQAVASPPGTLINHLQQYGWIYFITLIVFVVLAAKYKWFK